MPTGCLLPHWCLTIRSYLSGHLGDHKTVSPLAVPSAFACELSISSLPLTSLLLGGASCVRPVKIESSPEDLFLPSTATPSNDNNGQNKITSCLYDNRWCKLLSLLLPRIRKPSRQTAESKQEVLHTHTHLDMVVVAFISFSWPSRHPSRQTPPFNTSRLFLSKYGIDRSYGPRLCRTRARAI